MSTLKILQSTPVQLGKLWSSRFPGFLISCILAAAAANLGHLMPSVGAPIFAVLLGILFRGIIGVNDNLVPGISFTSKKVLQFAIILLGAGLSLPTLWQTGARSFIVMIGTLAVALIVGRLIGHFMKLPSNLISLISVGTGICGASAISSLSPILEAEESEIAYSISTIFLFNVVAVFLFPFLGHIFHFSDQVFGLWAGTAINDTSSVVAAGYAYSPSAGQYATIVKLTRSIMIIPVCLLFLIISNWRRNLQPKKSVKFPMFILGFVMMSLLATVGCFGKTGGEQISHAGQSLVVVALAAVGLGSDLKGLARTGIRPLLLGLITWILVACSSLILQKITGQL